MTTLTISKSKSTPAHVTAIWKRLQYDNRPIGVYRSLVDLLGSVKSAVYLSQMVYWHRKGINVAKTDGWFHKTATELTQETGLTKYEQETARAHLKTMGIIEVRMLGLPARPWFRINLDVFAQLLREHLQIDTYSHVDVHSALGRTVPFNTILAKITGGINTGLMLTFYIHTYCRDTQRNNGHVNKTIEDWRRESGLSYEEQALARTKLIELGLIAESHREMSRRIFTSININLCMKHFKEVDESEKCEKRGKLNAEPVQFLDHSESDLAMNQKGRPSYGETLNTAMAEPQILVWQNPKSCYGETRNPAMAKPEIVNIDKITKPKNTGKTTEPKITQANPQPQKTEPQQKQAQEQTPEPEPKTGIVVVGKLESLESLIWPESFTDDEQAIALKVLEGLNLIQAQTLLDELEGNASKPIRSKIGYLRALKGKVIDGTFIAEVAHIVAKRRAIQAHKRQEQANKPEPKARSEMSEEELKAARAKAKAAMELSKSGLKRRL